MAIPRAAVLTGHVLGAACSSPSLRRCIVLAVAVRSAFARTLGLEWVAAAGLVVRCSPSSLSWLSVAFGLTAETVESASNLPMVLVFLPFLSTGFVPTASLSPGPRWFAEHQPFTPIIEALRSLLVGTPMGDNLVLAVAWCAVISVAGYLWARRLYARRAAQRVGRELAERRDLGDGLGRSGRGRPAQRLSQTARQPGGDRAVDVAREAVADHHRRREDRRRSPASSSA